MSTEKELNSLHVLVTRPKPYGEILCEQIKERGGKATFFPTIEILPPENINFFEASLQRLDQFDWIIFTSPQAITQTFSMIRSIPPQIKIATIGAGTAKLISHSSSVVYPPNEWSSEGLLDLPEFNEVAGKNIAIIKGAEGRTFLANELTARGATVVPIIAYRRVLPATNNADVLRDLDCDVIICSSNEGLENLKILLKDQWSKLQHKRLVVVSHRMVAKAQELGFKDILLAQNASHEALIEKLVTVKEELYG